MKKNVMLPIVLALACLVLWSAAAVALELLYTMDGREYYRGNSGKTIVAEKMGAMILGPPDYKWWYGCSPTSAGMLIGFYDRTTYYPNLVDGVQLAELNTYPAGVYLVNNYIASSGHIADYWVAEGHIGDDPHPGGTHSFDCLADFMGTSQDLCGNHDGETTFWYYLDGSPLTPQDIIDEGIDPNTSGMYGIKEYIEWRGYNYAVLYNQYINPYHANGFTFPQFQGMIDECQPELLHIEGHTMFAWGYELPLTVYIHDTWTKGPHTMTWGGLYPPLTGGVHMAMTILAFANSPTVVQLASFSAVGRDGYIDVEWTTATELNNAGFNLYRSGSEEGTKTLLNERLIPARGDELQGATYTYRDFDVTGNGPFYYWFEDVGLDGNKKMSHPVKVEHLGAPNAFSLAQNSPNPFNPNTMIKYRLAEDCHVRLEVFNILGQRVATLVNEYQVAGSKVFQWNASNVASGTYFYRLQAGGFVETKKMVVLR